MLFILLVRETTYVGELAKPLSRTNKGVVAKSCDSLEEQQNTLSLLVTLLPINR